MVTARATEEEQAALSLEIDSDGVAWLLFDRPGSRANLLTTPVMLRLDALLAEVEEEIRRQRVKALIVRSGKPGMFIAGADVAELGMITDAADGAAKAAEGQRIFQRLESLHIPTIAAIEGVCLGGGTELALACRHRLAADSPETRIGLPEVRLGILPGFGGTVRLPRLVGLRAALELIVTGKSVDAGRAERMGLVDERVPAASLRDRARRLAWARIDQDSVPGPRRGRRGVVGRLLDDTAPGRRIVLWQARRRVLAETRGHYPAPLAVLETIRRTIARPLPEAFALEAEALGRLIVSDVCKNLVHVFGLTESAKKPPVDTSAVRTPERLAVLGAGVMGGGIAQVAAYQGLEVRLKDIDADALGRGLRHGRQLFDQLMRRRRLSRREAERAMARIAPALDYAGFSRVDLVIEAVVERLDVKRQVLAEVEKRVSENCVLTSNTSTIPIGELQHGLERPHNVCGMHFFNPVHRMPLVEIIRGAATSDEAVAAVFLLARRLDKTPVVVNDGPGFLVNRLLAPYLNEAGWLLTEGAEIGAVDRVLLDFGMPMGPYRLLDEVGLDVARHSAAVLYDAFGDRMRPAPAMIGLGETDRLGRKSGRGFYRYEKGKAKGADDSVYSDLGASVPVRRQKLPAELVRDRTVLPMINEAARALEDGIVSDAAAVDLAMIMGTGFPPFRGGLLRYADSLGTATIVEKLDRLAREHGPRFQPAPLLRARAAEGRGFYA